MAAYAAYFDTCKRIKIYGYFQLSLSHEIWQQADIVGTFSANKGKSQSQ